MIGSYKAAYSANYWAFGLCVDRLGAVVRVGGYARYFIWRAVR